jgi:hypothetical protein
MKEEHSDSGERGSRGPLANRPIIRQVDDCSHWDTGQLPPALVGRLHSVADAATVLS